MKRLGTILIVLAWSAVATAGGRGQGIFAAHCARCHVVGHGAAVATAPNGPVDITLAARKHDPAWLRAFLQAPYRVDVQSPCQAKLDERAAAEVERFLRGHARPVDGQASATPAPRGRGHGAAATPAAEVSAPVGKTPPDAVGNGAASSMAPPGGVPPQSVSRVVEPPPPPKKQGMVRR